MGISAGITFVRLIDRIFPISVLCPLQFELLQLDNKKIYIKKIFLPITFFPVLLQLKLRYKQYEILQKSPAHRPEGVSFHLEDLTCKTQCS